MKRFLYLIIVSFLGTTPVLAGVGDACTVANKVYSSEGPSTDVWICDAGTMTLKTARSLKSNPVREGIRTATPEATLHVDGEVIIGNTSLACSATTEGAIRYNTTSNEHEFCNGSAWAAIVTSACDNSPAFPSFTDQDELAGSTLVSSNIVAITGMDAGCSVSVGVSGTGGSPEYRTCSASDCSVVVQTWTSANNTLDIQGDYLQLRATSSAGSGTTFTITVDIGVLSSDWDITTGISGCSPVGTICSDGSVYAGISPDGSVPMYVARCDIGMSWGGASCDGSRSLRPWNTGDNGWVDTSLVNCGSAAGCDASGESNTATLVATDASTSAGFQNHVSAKDCSDLNVHGQTDWYLPSAPELELIYENLVDATPDNDSPDPLVTGFQTTGTYYWSSSELNSTSAWRQRFSDGNQSLNFKYYAHAVRCARR